MKSLYLRKRTNIKMAKEKTILARLKFVGINEELKNLGDVKARIKEIRKELAVRSEDGGITDPETYAKLTEEMARLKSIASVTNKEIRLQAKEFESLQFSLGSYKQLSAETARLRDSLKSLPIDAATEDFEKLKSKITENSKKLRDFDRAVSGNNTLVGEYTRGIADFFNEFGGIDLLKKQSKDLAKEQQNLIEKSKAVVSELVKTKKGTKEYEVLEAQARDLSKELKRVDKQIDNINNSFEKTSKGSKILEGALLGIGFTISQQLLGVIKDFATGSLKTFAGFEQELTNAGAIAGATSIEFEKLRTKALELGGDTQFLAQDISRAETNLSRLGFSANQTVDALSGIVDASTATNNGIDETADVIGTTIKAYKENASEATNLSDVIVKAFNTSALSLETYRESSKLIAPIANILKISFEEVTAAQGLLADSGLSGTIATQTISSALSRLADDNKKTAKAAKELGVEVFNQQGEFVGLAKLLENVEKATEGFADKQKQAAISQIFGQEASKNFSLLLTAQKKVITETGEQVLVGSNALRGYTKELENAGGTAAKTAAIQRDTLNAQFNIFLSAIQTLQIELVSLYEGGLRDVLGGLTELVNSFTDFIKLPVSEKLREEQAELNGLVGSITLVNDNQELRNDLISDLQTQYPDFLGKLNAETVTNEQLRAKLAEVNNEYEAKIILQSQEERIKDAADKQTEAFSRQRDALKELGNIIETKVRPELEKQGIVLIDSNDAVELARDAIEKYKNTRIGLSDFLSTDTSLTGERKGFTDLFGGTSKELELLIREIGGANKAYDEAASLVKNRLEERTALQNQYGQAANKSTSEIERLGAELESLKVKINSGDGSLIDEKRYKQVADKIAELKEQATPVKVDVDPIIDNKKTTSTAKKAGKNAAKTYTDEFNKQTSKAEIVAPKIEDSIKGIIPILEKSISDLEAQIKSVSDIDETLPLLEQLSELESQLSDVKKGVELLKDASTGISLSDDAASNVEKLTNTLEGLENLKAQQIEIGASTANIDKAIEKVNAQLESEQIKYDVKIDAAIGDLDSFQNELEEGIDEVLTETISNEVFDLSIDLRAGNISADEAKQQVSDLISELEATIGENLGNELFDIDRANEQLAALQSELSTIDIASTDITGFSDFGQIDEFAEQAGSKLEELKELYNSTDDPLLKFEISENIDEVNAKIDGLNLKKIELGAKASAQAFGSLNSGLSQIAGTFEEGTKAQKAFTKAAEIATVAQNAAALAATVSSIAQAGLQPFPANLVSIATVAAQILSTIASARKAFALSDGGDLEQISKKGKLPKSGGMIQAGSHSSGDDLHFRYAGTDFRAEGGELFLINKDGSPFVINKQLSGQMMADPVMADFLTSNGYNFSGFSVPKIASTKLANGGNIGELAARIPSFLGSIVNNSTTNVISNNSDNRIRDIAGQEIQRTVYVNPVAETIEVAETISTTNEAFRV